MLRIRRITAGLLVLMMAVALGACASSDEKVSNCSLFGAMFRVEYTESSGFSILTPYEWGALELNGGLILMPAGASLMDLLSSSETPSITVYDLSVYTSETEAIITSFAEDMTAGQWLETILTQNQPSKAVTTITKTGKDAACGVSTFSGSQRLYGVSVTKERAVVCVMEMSEGYATENANAVYSAEKDLMEMAKSLTHVELVAQ